MANCQWLIAKYTLSHPDSNRRYRNFTDSVLVGYLEQNKRPKSTTLGGVADYHRR